MPLKAKIISLHEFYNMGLPLPTNEKPSTSETQAAKHTTTTTANGASKQTGQNGQGQQQKTEAELEADRLYEERMEDEYAKREGGA
ncbi:hypothetical protein K402DRAFT_417490 [Aulographum hederae CBS 113979]|uniref:Uncharacterized protein n=1 Tax=Aulographum hederae CBS 113979 TaxID=1176131 RepID=A0A6G1HBY9_9PEZI|nr:hypothetical protein K402DRAFT_417490 [Aulographum hederae CBS 113979]